MPSIYDYNRKIRSLQSTRKITRTMKMVAASKLRRAFAEQAAARAYMLKFSELIYKILKSPESTDLHPLMQPREAPRNVLMLLVTSNKGLCGGFNNNLLRPAHQWLESAHQRYETVHLHCFGKRGHAFMKKHLPNAVLDDTATDRPRLSKAREIAQSAVSSYLTGFYDEVVVAYNEFLNPLSQRPTVETLLPIRFNDALYEYIPVPGMCLFEPPRDLLIEHLLPKYIAARVYYILLENAAGEHGARMAAMDNATKNTSEMIDDCRLLRNRARQAMITRELSEIISGAEALK